MKNGRHDQSSDGRGDPHGDPERAVAPQAAPRSKEQHPVADHQSCENAVVRTRERLGGQCDTEHDAAPDRWIIGQPVQRKHGERYASGHQQLHVRAVGVEVGTEREQNRRDHRRVSAS